MGRDPRGEATRLGWLCYHTHDSRKSQAGFPDIVAVRGNRAIFAELKKNDGRFSAAQETWSNLLGSVGGNVEYYCWRSADWDRIIELLKSA